MGTITGTIYDDQSLFGTSGNDTINALAGIDWIIGSTGNDRIDGGSGNSDVVMYSSLNAGVIINNTASQVGNVGAFRVLKSGGQQDTLVGIEAVHGTQFADKIYMSNNTYVFAEGGNDEIRVGTSVLVFAGSGNDTIYGGVGSWLDYKAGDQILQTRGIVAIWNTATSGVVTDDGWGNTDKFFGIGRISGSVFSDVMTGNIGNDQMSGVSGDDYLYGNGGADSIDGGDGNDMLFGGTGDDDITGGSGADSIYGGEGNNSLDAGDGNDAYFVQSDVAANDRIDDAGGDADILQVLDTAERDAYRLVYDGNTLVHETMQGHRTEIALDENGVPVIEYLQWMGSEEYGTENYTNTLRIITDLSNITGRLIAVAGTDGSDIIVMPNETPQDGEYWGEVYANGGDDNIVLSSTIQYITYGGDGNDNVVGYGNVGDYVDGEAGNDTLAGNNGDDTLLGGAGDDYLYGGEGNDSLIGNDGNNRFYGGAGSDQIIGGADDDVIEYIDDRSFGYAGTHGIIANLSSSSITANIGQGAGSQTVASGNVLDGFGGTDVVSGIDEIQATALADYVRSSDDGTNIWGHAGNDTLIGGAANDFITGGSGADVLNGAGGNWNILAYNSDTEWGEPATSHGVIVNLSAYGISANLGDGSGVRSVSASTALDGWNSVDQVSNFQTVLLSDLNDYAVAGASSIYMYGNAGDDTMIGGSGNDSILGDDGNDSLFGGDGVNRFYGGAGSDTIIGSLGYDIIEYVDDKSNGFAGAHGLIANLSSSSITVNIGQGAGSQLVASGNVLDGFGGTDVVSGIDEIQGTDLADYVRASDAGTNMWGHAGNDTLIGGAANDFITGGSGADLLDGAGGNWNMLAYNSDTEWNEPAISHGVIVNLSAYGIFSDLGDGQGTRSISATTALDGWNSLDRIANFQTVLLSDLNDYAVAGASSVYISGNAGNDTVIGGAGNETLLGDDGNDSIVGSNGDDSIFGGSGDDKLYGGDGNDTITDGFGYDTLDGGDGIDTLLRTYSPSVPFNDTLIIDLPNGTVSSLADPSEAPDVLLSIENIRVSGALNFILKGDAQANILEAGSGNDSLLGAAGNDTLQGAAGNDSLTGGDGVDTASYNGASAAVTVNLTMTSAQNTVGAGTDTLATIENLIGSAYNDTLTGDANANSLTGGSGNDSLYGGAGNDSLTGGAGSDLLTAGSGQNLIDGGDGNDVFLFRYEGNTIVNDAAGGNLLRVERQSGVYFSRLYYSDQGRLVLEGTNGSSITISNPANLSGIQWVPAGPEDGYSEYTIPLQNLVIGTLGGDLLTSPTTSYIEVYAADGNDQITVLSGSSWVSGDGGSDIVYGGQGDDLIHGDFRSLNTGSDTMFGGTGNDMIWGEAGQDTLDGGAGNDTLIGGADNDTYVIDAAGDVVTENANEGIDLVQSSISYALGSNVENLTLTGAAAITGTGNGLNNTITGNSEANSLSGLDGDDSLAAGAGNDTLDGGAGNDSLTGGDGIDTATYAAATAAVVVNFSLIAAQNTVGAGTDSLAGIENVIGSAFNDTLTGDANANGLSGALGNDTLIGGAGNDTLDGGVGNDVLTGGDGTDTASYTNAGAAVTISLALTTAQNTAGAGTDTLTTIENLLGSGFNDVLTGDANFNRIDGGAGNDTITGAVGADTLLGGDGDDMFVFALATELATGEAVTGGNGNDELRVTTATASTLVLTSGVAVEKVVIGTGTAVAAIATATTAINVDASGAANGLALIGNAGINTLTGTGFADSIDGGAGNDILIGGFGNDTLNGNTGTDTASYAAAAENLTLSLAVLTGQSAGSYGTDTFVGIENLTTGSGNDRLTGDANANALDGGAGNDTLDGGAGNDVLAGGTGTDTASYASAAAAVTVSLALTTAQNTGGAGTDTLTTFENLLGSGFNDVLTGDANANRIDGAAGNDTITGGAGIDALNGGEGSDIYMLSVLGDKTVAEIADSGASGTDELRFAATAAGTLSLAAGDTGLERVVIGTGTAASAVATATTALNINAAAAANGLTIIGNAGVNSLTGSAFNDIIDGGAGNDTLVGGVGNDTLYGGLGNDALTGGSGSDVFVFNTAPNASSNKDSISDFVSANDDIWLAKSVMAGLGANNGALSVDAFWSGAGVTASHDASDRIIYNSTTGALYYDADGNGSTAAVQIAQLTANTALTYQDIFIV